VKLVLSLVLRSGEFESLGALFSNDQTHSIRSSGFANLLQIRSGLQTQVCRFAILSFVHFEFERPDPLG
jgi:hypothetical protein